MMTSYVEGLKSRMRAGYPCIYVTAREDWRCLDETRRVAEGLERKFLGWTATQGFGGGDRTDPMDTISFLTTTAKERRKAYASGGDPGPGVCVALVNFHFYLSDPQTVQAVKDLVWEAKEAALTVVFISNVYKVPQELQDDFSLMEFGLPDKALVSERLDYVLKSVDGKVAIPENGARDSLVEAALGMTSWEAENAFTLSLVETGGLDAPFIAKEKARAVSKGGLLEFYEPEKAGMAAVGGLENLKEWLRMRRGAFSKAAREYGLPYPKGILLVGPPGTGKSLTAKAVSAEWGLPLVKFDLGRLFQGLVGASEANVRTALQTIDAISPAVVWLDEIEKGMAGASSSGQTDSGVSARVFGAILTWMQEKTRPSFVVATGNQVQNLPPELMRAGRFDEVFSTDLPDAGERSEILGIHLDRRGRKTLAWDGGQLAAVVAEMDGFSGAEIEAVVVKAMFSSFSQGRELEAGDLLQAAQVTVPLSETRREEIDAIRRWAQARAVPASKSKQTIAAIGRRVVI